jgi:hypothetical protein
MHAVDCKTNIKYRKTVYVAIENTELHLRDEGNYFRCEQRRGGMKMKRQKRQERRTTRRKMEKNTYFFT